MHIIYKKDEKFDDVQILLLGQTKIHFLKWLIYVSYSHRLNFTSIKHEPRVSIQLTKHSIFSKISHSLTVISNMIH